MLEAPLLLTRDQSRRVDEIAIRDFEIPGILLMENAGRGCAQLLMAQNPAGPVTIVTGKGNNAGDGFVIARHLHNQQIPVRLLLVTPPAEFQGEALLNWKIVAAMQLPWQQWNPAIATHEWLTDCCWIVDALLGTGIQGTVREPFLSAISQINQHRSRACRVLAVDVPSGLDCDTGQICGECVQADLTATFVAPKTGLTQNLGPARSGELRIVDIGVPRIVIDRALQAA